MGDYQYDGADRILSASGGTSGAYTVDANGDMTADPAGNSYSYDQEDRLIGATVGGAQASYAYDGDGQRAGKAVGGQQTSFLYDANAALNHALDDSTNRPIRRDVCLAAAFGESVDSGCSIPNTATNRSAQRVLMWIARRDGKQRTGDGYGDDALLATLHAPD